MACSEGSTKKKTLVNHHVKGQVQSPIVSSYKLRPQLNHQMGSCIKRAGDRPLSSSFHHHPPTLTRTHKLVIAILLCAIMVKIIPTVLLSTLAAWAGLVYSEPLPPYLYTRATLEEFITSQSQVSITGVLANIGPDGSKAGGVSAGLVVASPTRSNPDCKRAHPISSPHR